jgi:hypothetical protein
MELVICFCFELDFPSVMGTVMWGLCERIYATAVRFVRWFSPSMPRIITDDLDCMTSYSLEDDY